MVSPCRIAGASKVLAIGDGGFDGKGRVNAIQERMVASHKVSDILESTDEKGLAWSRGIPSIRSGAEGNTAQRL
jgi:hypothetical protein